MKVNLSEKSKAEFIDHISKQSINCWFEGDEFVMPCGQGRTSKGIVLYQLSVWQLKQAEVDQLQQYNDDLARGQCCLYKRLEEKDKRIEAALAIVNKMAKAPISTAMWAYDLEKALRGEHES